MKQEESLMVEKKQHIRWICKDENGNGICNFYPKVLRKIEVKSSRGIEYYVLLKLLFENGESEELTLPLLELEGLNWYKMDQRCIFNEKCRKTQASMFVENIIRRKSLNVPVERKVLLEELGVNVVDGKTVFFAGDRVITRSSDKDLLPGIQLKKVPFKLDIDVGITRYDAIKGMQELMCLSPEIGRILVAHVISGIIRTAFKEAGFIPCSVLVIEGESGMLKSHYVPHLTQLYNRNAGIAPITRFNSTKRFIEDVLHEYSECTAVIDDLHTAESREIRRINESTAEEIIRRISDDTGRGYKKGNESVQKSFRGNVIFIGEYMIGRKSTIPRALVVKITKKPNGAILDKYQRHNPLLVSTLYYYFIQWYMDNYEKICAAIDRKLTIFRSTSADSEIHGRLVDTGFYLKIAYMFFVEFCADSDFWNPDEKNREYKEFQNQIDNLVQKQQNKFVLEKYDAKTFLKSIRRAYKGKRFCLAENEKAFCPEKHDGLIYYECLCLRKNCLEKMLRENFPNIKFSEIIESLVLEGALKRGKEKNTVKISTLNKEVGAVRFYAIWLHALE